MLICSKNSVQFGFLSKSVVFISFFTKLADMNYAQGLKPCTITDMPSNGARQKTKRRNAKRKARK